MRQLSQAARKGLFRSLHESGSRLLPAGVVPDLGVQRAMVSGRPLNEDGDWLRAG